MSEFLQKELERLKALAKEYDTLKKLIDRERDWQGVKNKAKELLFWIPIGGGALWLLEANLKSWLLELLK